MFVVWYETLFNSECLSMSLFLLQSFAFLSAAHLLRQITFMDWLKEFIHVKGVRFVVLWVLLMSIVELFSRVVFLSVNVCWLGLGTERNLFHCLV